jgi:uncharacterized protein YkwD
VTPTAASAIEHTVEVGDTLLGIAMAYDVPMASIQLLNRMGESTVVRVGEVLLLPSDDRWEGVSPFWVVCVVGPGETLLGIASAYGLAVGALRSANGLADGDPIFAGQALILPLDAPVVVRAPDSTAVAPTPSPLPQATPDAASTATPVGLPDGALAAPVPSDVADWPYETVRLINDVRAQHGLPPLSYNETLAAAAQVQANDCAARGWCSHTGSDGSDIKTRILRAGYAPASWAECWAVRPSPQGAVDIWMDEVPPDDPHRRTLLATWLTEIGIGVAPTDWGYYYFIADFGRP